MLDKNYQKSVFLILIYSESWYTLTRVWLLPFFSTPKLSSGTQGHHLNGEVVTKKLGNARVKEMIIGAPSSTIWCMLMSCNKRYSFYFHSSAASFKYFNVCHIVWGWLHTLEVSYHLRKLYTDVIFIFYLRSLFSHSSALSHAESDSETYWLDSKFQLSPSSSLLQPCGTNISSKDEWSRRKHLCKFSPLRSCKY